MSVKVEYWSAVTTVVPVLSLALVIEARAQFNKWDRDIPAWYRTLQSLYWVGLLVSAAVAENTAFAALSGEPPPNRGPTLCSTVIAWLFAALVISPAAEFLVRGPSDTWALLLTLHPRSSWRLRRALKKQERKMVGTEPLKDACTSIIAGIDVKLARLDKLEGDPKTELERSAIRAELKTLKLSTLANLDWYENIRQKGESLRNRSDKHYRDLADVRKEFAEDLLKYGSTFGSSSLKSAGPTVDDETRSDPKPGS